jgi:hypothetical protein
LRCFGSIPRELRDALFFATFRPLHIADRAREIMWIGLRLLASFFFCFFLSLSNAMRLFIWAAVAMSELKFKSKGKKLAFHNRLMRCARMRRDQNSRISIFTEEGGLKSPNF